MLLILALTSCSSGDTSAVVPSKSASESATKPNVSLQNNSYTVVKDTSSDKRKPTRLYFRRHSIRESDISLASRYASIVLKRTDEIADLTPLSIIMQPGDQCGADPPAYQYDITPQFCVGWTYNNQVDASCGTLEWYVDDPSFPQGTNVSIVPSTSPTNDVAAMSIKLPANAPPGDYQYYVGARCQNPGASAGPSTILPDSIETDLVIVSTDIVDETRTSPTVITSPGSLIDEVGQQEELKATISPSDLQPLVSNGLWTIPSAANPETSYVASYQRSATSAASIPVSLNGPNLQFFPIAAAAQIGNITFTAPYAGPGTAFHATTGFQIDSPTVEISHQTNGLSIGFALPNGESTSTNNAPLITALKVGGVSQLSPGITLSATFSSPSSDVSGQVGMTQLTSIYDGWNPQPITASPEFSVYTFGFQLDSGEQYPFINTALNPVTTNATQNLVSLPASGKASWTTVETPSTKLFSCTPYVFAGHSSQSYFDFIPTPKAGFPSIPVTIGFTSWSYYATTSQTVTGINLPSSWAAPQNNGSAPTITFSTDENQVPALPQWSDTLSHLLAEGSYPSC